jgi:hypothetical protein
MVSVVYSIRTVTWWSEYRWCLNWWSGLLDSLIQRVTNNETTVFARQRNTKQQLNYSNEERCFTRGACQGVTNGASLEVSQSGKRRLKGWDEMASSLRVGLWREDLISAGEFSCGVFASGQWRESGNWRISINKSHYQETASGERNRLRTLVCVCMCDSEMHSVVTNLIL